MALAERLWDRVDKQGGGPVPCWLWLGAKISQGYGQISVDGKRKRVHRVAYELERGPIPDGLELDHLCRVRHCVNPAHLEAVTHKENLRRGHGVIGRQMRSTACPSGHPYDEQNTRYYRGIRYCKECRRLWNREYRKRKRADLAEGANDFGMREGEC